MDDINLWYNTFAYQRSNETAKEWYNKLMAIGIFQCLEKCTIISTSVVHRLEKTFCNSIIQMTVISRNIHLEINR